MKLEIEDSDEVVEAPPGSAPARIGRPRTLDRAKLGEEICYRVSQGELTTDVCRDLGLANDTAWVWARDDESFANNYARARVSQAHAWAERAVRIAEGSDNLSMAYKDIIEAATSDMEPNEARKLAFVLHGGLVQRNRLQTDTIKWFVSKIAPRIYGEKIDITSGDKPLMPQRLEIEFVEKSA